MCFSLYGKYCALTLFYKNQIFLGETKSSPYFEPSFLPIFNIDSQNAPFDLSVSFCGHLKLARILSENPISNLTLVVASWNTSNKIVLYSISAD